MAQLNRSPLRARLGAAVGGPGALGALGLSLIGALSLSARPAAAEAGVSITSYGHSALLIQGGGATVL